MKYNFILLATIAFIGIGAIAASAQSKRTLGTVCGDPTGKCPRSDGFQPNDLPFDHGKNWVIAESGYFYGIVLRSVKFENEWGDCEHPSFTETERLAIQEKFPRNKVFTQNCVDPGINYYTGIADKTAIVGVYAGKTLTEAKAFLKKVQASGEFPGVRVRRMKVGVNGT